MIGPGDNPLSMPDEEFSQLVAPPVAEAAEAGATPEDENPGKSVIENDGTDTDDDSKTEDDDDTVVDDEDEEIVEEDGDKSKEGDNLPKDKSLEQSKPDLKSTEGAKDKDGKSVPASETKGEAVTPDYQGFYEKMMAPLKANGKTIDIKNPDEAVQLMQMGANYTRKMQALAPHRKMLLMLENNGLLDEGKLSFLIDIEKKNPEAIKKLLKDSGIDPLDLDTSADSTYQEGNHRVSDEESTFRTALDELSSNPDGRETLKLINTQWDQASKDILWKQPEVMTLIHQQRDSGVYELISTEMERQRTLGAIPANVSFLQAYKKIGDDLAEAGAFAHLDQKAETKPAAVPLVTRKATPKPAAVNGDKVSAASSTRTNSRKAETGINPLALADDDFMKEVARFQGRV